jgi:hypothetical protein
MTQWIDAAQGAASSLAGVVVAVPAAAAAASLILGTAGWKLIDLAMRRYEAQEPPWGAATQSGAESAVETRPLRESLLHSTAALTFSASLAYLQEALGDTTGQWRRAGARIQQHDT